VHFFGYFLCASKESDSAARKADETTQGRESVFARRDDSKDKVKMDPGLRRDDELRSFRRQATGPARADASALRNLLCLYPYPK